MSRRAVLIGCNYAAIPSIQLSGCINDVVNVRNTLIDAYGYLDSNIFLLRDDDNTKLPRKANILSLLNRVISISNTNDMLWIHYSGHGTRIRDINGDETDSLDECIVPCDYNTAGLITDDELYNIIKNAKCRMIICLDSCNSGTGCDLQYTINYNNGILTRGINSRARPIVNPNIIMLSGCRDEQTSSDAYDPFARQGVGAFTYTLLESLRLSDHNISIMALYPRICASLKKYTFTQIPVLSSSAASPTFQFTRSNGTSVSRSFNDLVLYDMRLKTVSTNVIRNRMAEICQLNR